MTARRPSPVRKGQPSALPGHARHPWRCAGGRNCQCGNAKLGHGFSLVYCQAIAWRLPVASSEERGTSLASFYLLSLALGVLIVSVRGNNVDLLHVLFGTVLSLNNEALLLLGAIATLTMGGLALLYRPLVLECLDPAFLRMVSRWSPVAHYGFLGLLVLNLVAGFHALGTLMAVGLLVLPAATARLWVRQLAPMLLLSTGVALLGCSAGLLLSFHLDWPSGPTIVICLGALYLASIAFGHLGVLRLRSSSPLKG